MNIISSSKEIINDTQSMSKQAVTYHLLKEALIHQDFKPGSVLSERELCTHFGVSRPPVHNAVVQLVSDGMLKMEHEKKIIVPHTTPADLHEIYEMLEYIQVASRTSQRLSSSESIRNLKATLMKMEESINDPSLTIFERYSLDNQFHSFILQDSDNNRMKKSFEKYSNQYAMYASVMFKANNWREHELHTHQHIFEAINNGMLSDFSKILHEHYATAFSNYLIWSGA